MRLLNYILDLFFPPLCICCKEPLSVDTAIPFCDECQEKLTLIKKDRAKELGSTYVDKCYCIYPYRENEVREIIFHVKNIFSKRYREYFKTEAEESLRLHNLFGQIDVVCFSPRRKGEKKKFGFDQAEEMAKCISEVLGVPTLPLIERVGNTKMQKKLNAIERRENVKGKFKCSYDLDGKTILLTDDVVTTGATVCEMAKILKNCGAKRVFIYSIAD